MTSLVSLNDVLSRVTQNSFKNFNLKGLNVIKNANVYDNHNKFVQKTLFFSNNILLDSDTFIKTVSNQEEVNIFNGEKSFITPTMCDQHIHGHSGIDFNKNKELKIRQLLVKLKKFGYGEILATLTPDTIENLNSQMDIIRKIIQNPKTNETKISGINLEGPFFSPKKSGIHSPDILLIPNIENLKKFNLDNVKMLTIAPELKGACEAIDYLNQQGIISSAGHSEATAEQVKTSGVNCITHLFNAMVGYHHREPTIANEALENDNIYIEVNTAFELIKPNTINMIYKYKPHDKIILISDSLKGAKPGKNHFIMGEKQIIIDENNIAKDDNGVLAGSIKSLGEVVKNFMDSTLLNFSDFIKFTTQNPRNLLNLKEKKYLETGTKPSFVIWDKETYKPIKTFIEGE